MLDSTRENGGRLELQENMELQGVAGHSSQVVIDASVLPGASFIPAMNTPAPRTGAIRIGRGTNILQWLTVKGNASQQALSVIDADLIWPGKAKLTISNCVITGGRIGIDLRNVSAASNGRQIEATINNNEVRDNLVQFGQGIEVQNANGVTQARIRVSMHGNYLHGNKIGLRGFSNNANGQATDSSSIYIQSDNDRFEENGIGLQLIGGLNQAPTQTANSNFLHFEAYQTSIRNNHGEQSPDITDLAPGGLNAAGGSSVRGGETSRNSLEIFLVDCPVSDNTGPGIKAYGAFSPVSTIAGTGNKVAITLRGSSKSVNVQTISSEPGEPAGTNSVRIFK
ncbi:MAG: hypothetical protein ABI091_19495 [Ferruginibacter sp.]